MEIRPFRPEDLDEIRRLTVEAFDGVSIDQNIEQQFGPIAGKNWQWRKGRHIDADAAREPTGIFVAWHAGRIVGSITTWMDHDAGIGHVPNLTLTADVRGRGYGRQLLEFALRRFREHGLTHTRIETLEQNPTARKLYESYGFQEVARQIHYCGDLETCLLRTRNPHGTPEPD